MTIKEHEHGVVNSRCAHQDCVAATHRYEKRWKYDASQGIYRTIDIAPTRLHIATLRGLGWSLRAIAAEAGLSPTTLSRITRETGRSKVARRVAEAVISVDPNKIPVKGSRPTSEPFVSRIGTTRRLQALLAIGWTHRELATHGISSRNLLHQQGQWVTRSTHDKVAAIYRDLCHRPGTSVRTIKWALKLGYISPAGWDDIDRDQAPEIDDAPTGSDAHWETTVDDAMVERILSRGQRPRRITQAEGAEAYQRLRAAGLSTTQIEDNYGLNSQRYSDREDIAS